MNSLEKSDPEMYELNKGEENRQQADLNFIASENYVSRAILEITGSVFTNKYSEGYPGKRYYGGQFYTDPAEILGQERGLKLFGLKEGWRVNMQPHSGSNANLAVYKALAEPGKDTIMGLLLSHGGHLTHGHKVSISGTVWKAQQYGVDIKTGLLDYDAIEALAWEIRPKIIISGYSAYPRIVNFERFYKIAKRVGAYHMVDMAHIAGLIAGGAYPSPFPYADVVTTTTHKTLRGPRGGVIFSRKEISEKIDKALFPGIQGGPLMHAVAAKAVCFKEAQSAVFKKYAKQIVKNAKVLAAELQNLGYELVSGGTDSHLLLVDLRNKNIGGKETEELLGEAGITVNKNTIPDDKSAFNPSGIRLGTPALTTRGMKEKEMRQAVSLIHRTLTYGDKTAIKKEVLKLCKKFPIK